MKHFATLIVLVLMVSTLTSGQMTESGRSFSDSDIRNLNNCIASENTGVKEWGIYLAGKYKISESVEALTETYTGSNSPSLKKRVLFSLFQINTEKSRAAIAAITVHEESVSLRKLCQAMNSQSLNSYASGM